MLIYLLFLSLLYQLLFLFLGRGLLKPEAPLKLKPLSKQSSIALVVVHRNNPQELEQTIARIQEQNKSLNSWPLYILDDHSAEKHQGTLSQLATAHGAELISSEAQVGKKQALAWFLPRIKENYLIQTDSDCHLEDNFLWMMAQAIEESAADMYVGRVLMRPTKNIWSKLAALDHLSLQLVTFSALRQSKVVMAAGASMAYKRETFLNFLDVGKRWAGGEDTFVAQAMAQNGAKVIPMPYASVRTAAPQNFESFIRQRLRWGAKSAAYPSLLSKSLAFSVALLNLSFVIALFVAPFWEVPRLIWMLWFYKMMGDALLLFRYTSFYGGSSLLRNYLILALLYPFYISLVLILSPFSSKGKWLGS